MTRSTTQSLLPDSLSGIVFALEGIERTCVLLNGPTGCKFYHSAISDQQRTRQWAFDPLNFPVTWYFGQPRVPCTYLDSHDYVYGSREKLEEAVGFLVEHTDLDLLAVVNSPGAALIGDDLEGIVSRVAGDIPLVTFQTPGFSSNICHGFEAGIAALFEQLGIEKGERPAAWIRPTVNVLGLSLYHKYHEGTAIELRRLFDLCGVDVNCLLGQSGGLESLQSAPAADLNVVVHPEYGLGTAAFLQERYGTPYVVAGPPIGFDATDKMLRGVCGALGCDPEPALLEGERARAKAYVNISRLNSLTGLPKGVRYSVEATCSELAAFLGFFTGYLGMAPVAMEDMAPQSGCCRTQLEQALAARGFAQALDADIDADCGELVFATGETIGRLKLGERRFSGIEVALPTIGYIDVLPKTQWGHTGALMLVEQVINGLVY